MSHPKGDAIFVYAVSGLLITFCKIEGVDLGLGFGDGIDINTASGIPAPTSPGKPEGVSGRLLIVNNDIDVGATVPRNTAGVVLWSVGVPGAEVEAHISENRIRNTTEPAINLRRAIGRVFVERNIIRTGSVFGKPMNIQAIRAANTGTFLIAHNKIECEWGHPDVQGIGVFSQVAEWPIEGAIVVDNEVTMSPPEGALFSDRSGGITISGFAQGNVVMANRKTIEPLYLPDNKLAQRTPPNTANGRSNLWRDFGRSNDEVQWSNERLQQRASAVG